MNSDECFDPVIGSLTQAHRSCPFKAYNLMGEKTPKTECYVKDITKENKKWIIDKIALC